MTIYCVADIHANHQAILGYCNRPFKGLPHMLKEYEKIWNSIVQQDDITYIMGDLWMGKDGVQKLEKFLNKLKGRKVLILGNHDEIKPFTYVRHGIESVHTSLMLSPDYTGLPIEVFLGHDPALYTVLTEGAFMVCGHVHQLFKIQKGCVNAGIDVWQRPVSLDELYEVYDKEYM